jgi:hypothetical protein
MNRIFVLFISILGISSMNAQIHEIGVFLGGSNYVGDIGPTNYVAPNEPAFGILYKWNKSPRHSYRFSYTQTTISSDDKDSKVPSRNLRNLNFKNSIKEVSLGLEFDFFDFNLHDGKKKITPYVYSGVSYFAFYQYYYVNNQTKEDYYDGSFAIPMTIGVKSNITDNLILGFEVATRYTFTDNLDGSNPKNPNLSFDRFGNINSNDWFTFTGFTLTYTFGNKPCYCTD